MHGKAIGVAPCILMVVYLRHNKQVRLSMQLHTEFQLHIMFLNLDIDPSAPNIKICTVLHTTK